MSDIAPIVIYEGRWRNTDYSSWVQLSQCCHNPVCPPQRCTERRCFTTSDAPSSLSTNTGHPRTKQHLSQSLASLNITIFSLCFLTDDGASLLCKCQMNHKPIPYAIAIC
ncbi:hypothetical protein QQF64_027722 [Cirrhinus molitorella]|uniref:Uncharacterized protein n=1 Tax=Cirrhinus molitorella TaxID=172907 RepID=A0ABR3ND66_9TELE